MADDEPLALRRVLRSLSELEGIEVVGTAADGAEALEAIGALKPDLLLLDIMMPGLTGFELLDALDEDSAPAVIFITAFDHFAVSAFAEGAIDYILKPLDDERLAVAIERAKTRLQQDANRQRFEQLRKTIARMNTDFNTAISSTYERDLWVRESGKVLRVRVEDIDWIEAAGDYVALHTEGNVLLADDSIRSLSERLDPTHFMQVHRSAIVKIDAVAEINREKFSSISLRMRSGERVRVSKSHKRAVLDRISVP
ncbi:MAG: LytTR family DNA-binding domain-containing protein [Pseudomonadota bacterium]